MLPSINQQLPRTVLLITDMFHPVNDLAVELFLDGDVGHPCTRRCSVPVLFTGREPDDITRANLLNRSAFALHPAKTRGHDESLSERMSVPCGPRARLEGYARALNQRGIRCLEERIDAYVPREPLGRSLRRWLRAGSFDFHIFALLLLILFFA